MPCSFNQEGDSVLYLLLVSDVLEGTDLSGACCTVHVCPSIENGFDLNMWKQAIHRATVEHVVKKKVSQAHCLLSGYEAGGILCIMITSVS